MNYQSLTNDKSLENRYEELLQDLTVKLEQSEKNLKISYTDFEALSEEKKHLENAVIYNIIMFSTITSKQISSFWNKIK